MVLVCCFSIFFFFKQKTAYEMRISDWSSDVCSSDLQALHPAFAADVPFVAAVVELEEGVRMATRLVDCERDILALDLPVELDFEMIGGDFRLDRKSVV